MKSKYLLSILFVCAMIGILTTNIWAICISPLSLLVIHPFFAQGDVPTFFSVITPTVWPTPTESPSPTVPPSPTPSPSPTATVVLAELPPTPTPKLSSEQEQLGGLAVSIFVAITLIIALAAAIWTIRSGRNRR